jgi:hypothetical protein
MNAMRGYKMPACAFLLKSYITKTIKRESISRPALIHCPTLATNQMQALQPA